MSMFGGGGVFGSGGKTSSSASSQETTTVNTTLDATDQEGVINLSTVNKDYTFDKIVADDGAKQNINIVNEVTDFGALDTAGGISESAFNMVGESIDKTLEAVKESHSNSLSAVNAATSDAQKTARSVAQSDTTETITTLVYGLSAVAGLWAIAWGFKNFKK